MDRPPINWLSQVAAITRFGLMSLPQRRGAVAATVIGIAGVVAVLVGVLSIAAGFRQAMAVSGSPDAAIVLRSGADSEMVSGFGREETRVIADAPGVARTAHGPARLRGVVRHHQPAQALHRHGCQCAVARRGARRRCRCATS